MSFRCSHELIDDVAGECRKLPVDSGTRQNVPDFGNDFCKQAQLDHRQFNQEQAGLSRRAALKKYHAVEDAADLRTIGAHRFFEDFAPNEAIYIRSDDPARPPQAVSIDRSTQSGLVVLVSPEGLIEEELYVRFAADLDNREAMSLSICHARGYALAADERKARRLARSLTPAMDFLSTAEILHRRAARTATEGETLRRVIQAVEISTAP